MDLNRRVDGTNALGIVKQGVKHSLELLKLWLNNGVQLSNLKRNGDENESTN